MTFFALRSANVRDLRNYYLVPKGFNSLNQWFSREKILEEFYFLCVKLFFVLISTYRKLNNFIDDHKLRPIADVVVFMIIIVFFHKLWWDWGLKSFLLTYLSFAELEQFMARQVFLPSAWITQHIIGYDINTLDTTLHFPGVGYIEVNGSCSGLKQFYQWIFLMVLFPGPWKQKLWYIPLGIIVIHIVNILRIVILSIVLMNWPDQWHFTHDWILRPFFYVVIFFLWVFWVEKFRNKQLQKRAKAKSA